MNRLLGRVLDLRPGEERLAALGAGLFGLVQAGQAFALNSADALLFERYGVEILPLLYMALGASTLVATTAYAAVLGRSDRASQSNRILAGLSLLGGLAWAATQIDEPAVYPAVWLGVALIQAVLGTLIWVLAGEVCDPRQAKRLFNVFASAGILGGVLAGFLTGPLARLLGTESLLLAFTAVGMLAAAAGRLLIARFARRAAGRPAPSSPLTGLRHAHRIVWSNPTMRLTAAAAVVFSILFFTVSFPFNVEVAAAFPDGAELAGFLGVFSGLVTAATFLVALLAASRVFARLGVIQALLLLPLVYLGGFVLWTVRLDLVTAAVFRFSQLVVLGGLASTAYGALFNVIPAEQRAQVRAYQGGPPAQLGVMLSGVLILLGQRGLSAAQALGIGVLFSVIGAALVWRMRTTYAASLVQALRQGVVEVFTAVESRFDVLRQDAQARRAALDGLGDERPEVRRISIGILAELRAELPPEVLEQLAKDGDIDVRLGTLRALGRLSGDARPTATRFLDDRKALVRAAAVTTAAALGALSYERATALLADPSPQVRARAAIVVAGGERRAQALEVVAALLADASEEARLAGVQACAEVEGLEAVDTLIATLRDAGPRLREAATAALARHPVSGAIAALVTALADPEARVRRAAADALGRIGAAEGELIAALDHASPLAQEEAAAALAGRGGLAADGLLRWASRQVDEAAAARRWRRSLDRSDAPAAERALAEILARHESRQTRRALKALAGAGSGASMRTIDRGLRSRDPDLRSQAIEALDTIGDRQVTRRLVQLLEPEAEPAEPPPAGQTLAELADHSRAWFRALALRARVDALRHEWRQIQNRARSDPAAIIRQAIDPDGPLLAGGDMVETSTTLGVVERVLFLRQVPIFRLLEPEDLERIAGLAREQLHQAGEWLCREGEVGDELFVLVDGAVEVSKSAPDGERVLRTLNAGEHLGELAILREQPRSASVRAVGPVRTLVLGGDALRAILEERPVVGLGMLESLADRLSTLG